MKLAVLQFGIHPMTGAPVPGFVVEADDGSIVLVDSGFPRLAPDEACPSRFRITEEDHVVHRLALLGIRPRDVRFLVCSHFDPDHAGGHDLFVAAECVVQRRHHVVARSGRHSRFEIQRAHWDDPRLRYRLVDGDVCLLPGIDLIESSGHVPGHQSVLVWLRDRGPVLLAVDAMTTAKQADIDAPRHRFDLDPETALDSVRKLSAIAVREQVGLIVYGHDATQWRTLSLAPTWYT